MMNKKMKIGIIAAFVIAVGIIGFIVFGNSNDTPEGIDETITNEQDKEGNTSLDNNKVLVLYFSQSGNTQKLAKLISDRVGGDFVRIETVQTYPDTYEELADFAKEGRDNDVHPELKDLNINLDDYDTIFIGYPIWWYQMPMPMYTLFDTYDFGGKTIVPFNTHEGSKDGGTYEDIQELEPNATVLEGLPIRGGDMENDQSSQVDDWLKELGFIE